MENVDQVCGKLIRYWERRGICGKIKWVYIIDFFHCESGLGGKKKPPLISACSSNTSRLDYKKRRLGNKSSEGEYVEYVATLQLYDVSM